MLTECSTLRRVSAPIEDIALITASPTVRCHCCGSGHRNSRNSHHDRDQPGCHVVVGVRSVIELNSVWLSSPFQSQSRFFISSVSASWDHSVIVIDRLLLFGTWGWEHQRRPWSVCSLGYALMGAEYGTICKAEAMMPTELPDIRQYATIDAFLSK